MYNVRAPQGRSIHEPQWHSVWPEFVHLDETASMTMGKVRLT